MENPIRINVYSSADKVDGQGVGSAYQEQVKLISERTDGAFDVACNTWTRPADIQHFHTIDPAFFVKLMDKKPVNIAYCHFLPDTVIDGSLKIPGPFQNFLSKYIIQFYKQADWLVVVNPSFIPALEAYGIDPARIKYIPNYVDHDKFRPLGAEARARLLHKLGIPEDAFVILGAGQVQTRKGVLDFVKTAEALPDFQFVWAGGFSFGAMTDGYEELKAIMENPPANVHFPGIVPREEMVEYYNMANVLFVPSYNELFPMTILEAVNCHVPLVLRDLDLYKDILFDHYLRGSDVDQFIYLIQSLHDDPSLYEMYRGESEQISSYYSAEHVASMWKDFYLKALEAHKEGQQAA